MEVVDHVGIKYVTEGPKLRKRAARVVLLGLASLSLGVVTAQGDPVSVTEGAEAFSKRVLATGLEFPWEITYGPDDYIWVTERSGKRVTRVNPKDGSKTIALTVDEALVGPQHEGILGMALHPELLQDTGNDYVYLAYTHNVGEDEAENIDRRAKLVRYSYDTETEKLGEPSEILSDLPASNDHNAGRLVFGPDGKLYYALGDQGNNQFANFLLPIRSQELPSAEQIAAKDWTLYAGKVLRLNTDGSVPEDNPEVGGVRSHIYTYGHRNPQGLAFGPDGTLYSSEQGPKSDDEVNILAAGKNYGWPEVAGYQDDRAYAYANWSETANPPADFTFSDYVVPEIVPQQAESDWSSPDFVEPIQAFFTVENSFDFAATCGFICWPTIAPPSVAYYSAGESGIEAWDNSLLITSLKHGAIYRLRLSDDAQSVEGEPLLYFDSANRYRDHAFSPDGRTIYISTDNEGLTADSAEGGLGFTPELENPGAILSFTYEGEE